MRILNSISSSNPVDHLSFTLAIMVAVKALWFDVCSYGNHLMEAETVDSNSTERIMPKVPIFCRPNPCNRVVLDDTSWEIDKLF